ncbi:hypothetical protein KP509_1Z214700 [Ceratopteris richardii]|nr:hypothetical protein KP509_1Z214700 [Ceratopteris richardii]
MVCDGRPIGIPLPPDHLSSVCSPLSSGSLHKNLHPFAFPLHTNCVEKTPDFAFSFYLFLPICNEFNFGADTRVFFFFPRLTSAGTKAGTNELFVTWALNSTAQVDDSAYRSVELKLCFGAPSQIDRRWRKTNDILSKDKSCSFDIGSPQPYQRAGNSTVWIVGNDIPFAQYFVRAYGLDSAGEKVAYGQSSNAQRTSNLFTVEPISGRRASIDISAAVFSAFSVLSLCGFFLYEKMSAKGNKA